MGCRDRGNRPPAGADEHFPFAEFLAAVIAEAWRKAALLSSLVAAKRGHPSLALRECPALATEEQIARIPNANFWLELGTALRLRQWEENGLTTVIPMDLPSFEDAMACLRQVLASATHMDSCPLTRRQLDTWLSHFAWRAPEMLGVDAVLNGDPTASDDFLDELAMLLWNCRESDSAEFDRTIKGG